MNINETWVLDDLYKGGLEGEAFQDQVYTLVQSRDKLIQELDVFELKEPSQQTEWLQLLNQIAFFKQSILHLQTFAQMTSDANTKDEYAAQMVHQLTTIKQPFEMAYHRFIKMYARLSSEVWEALLDHPNLQAIAFVLNEEREQARKLLSEETEALLTQLNSDGLAAWSSIYDTTSASMTIEVELSDGKHIFSVGQAMNRMYADENPKNRQAIFKAWEKAFTKNGAIFAEIINHLAGYRLTTQAAHGYTHFLDEPLEYNRMQPETLLAMWKAVDEGKDIFVEFLRKKQALLGLDALDWQDVDAPLTFAGEKTVAYTYEEACEFVVEQFATFGPKLRDFAQMALENRWVEAENRENKRPGGYCTELPLIQESRIFMTFTGSASDTSTLAHELGHAFHSYMMKDEAYWNKNYAMNVAETASTFAETIVANANLARAQTPKERLQLLNVKLENATAMFLNIHTRFLFEEAFYMERKKGFVSETRLNTLMSEAQEKAYQGVLAEKHPHFWASKLHFFMDDVPFYNFPYTFGYLFSLGLYALYLKQPLGFEERYIALLKDTGKMSVEALAKKHLNVDLTQPDFWMEGVNLATEDAKRFIAEATALMESQK